MNGMVGVVKKESGEEFITGLVEGERGWSNQEVEVVKEGLGEVDMIGEGEQKIKRVEEMLEEGEEYFMEVEKSGKEDQGLQKSVHATGQRRLEDIGKMFEGRNVWVEDDIWKKGFVGERLFETEEDEEGLDSLGSVEVEEAGKGEEGERGEEAEREGGDG